MQIRLLRLFLPFIIYVLRHKAHQVRTTSDTDYQNEDVMSVSNDPDTSDFDDDLDDEDFEGEEEDEDDEDI